jgi:hypothetical protein
VTVAAFRKQTNALIACLERASAGAAPVTSVPAIIECFARRAVRDDRVPNRVWLSQRGEMRANLSDAWRPFTAEQVISIREPGFVWRARMQAARLVSAHP